MYFRTCHVKPTPTRRSNTNGRVHQGNLGTQRFFRKVSVAHHGMELSFADMTLAENVKRLLKPNTKMVWVETPSNPLLKIVDIAAVAAVVKEFNKDIWVVVDNTFMSPYFQVRIWIEFYSV